MEGMLSCPHTFGRVVYNLLFVFLSVYSISRLHVFKTKFTIEIEN